jgi:hypothetical protein
MPIDGAIDWHHRLQWTSGTKLALAPQGIDLTTPFDWRDSPYTSSGGIDEVANFPLSRLESAMMPQNAESHTGSGDDNCEAKRSA